jgi:hypothetical protein
VSSPNLLQVVSIPHAHLPCHGYAIAPIISSARLETDPSSKMASLVAENTHPRRPTYVSTALGPAKHLFEGLQQPRRGLYPSPPRFLRPVGESPLYGLERLP